LFILGLTSKRNKRGQTSSSYRKSLRNNAGKNDWWSWDIKSL